MTEARIEASPVVAPNFKTPTSNNLTPPLKCILCIYYPIRFNKDQVKVQALIDFGSKVNTMTLVYVARLYLKVRPTNVNA